MPCAQVKSHMMLLPSQSTPMPVDPPIPEPVQLITHPLGDTSPLTSHLFQRGGEMLGLPRPVLPSLHATALDLPDR